MMIAKPVGCTTLFSTVSLTGSTVASAVGCAWVVVLLGARPAAAQPAAAPDAGTQTVEVIGSSPLPGLGVDRSVLPYSTQLFRRATLEQADHLSDLLVRRAASVQVNDIQGSRYQGDVTFRGYRASGLIGAAQGLAVYLDGVRINEPFGDVVNWDLVPEQALANVALVPGANPAFGLNTLGGALALRTADGRSAPGLRGELSAGSFGQRRLHVSHGAASSDQQHYLSLGLFDERGWRDHSPGRLGHALAKLGQQTALGEFTISALLAQSRLVGNGLVPLETVDAEEGSRSPDLGAQQRNAVYTHPDRTIQRLQQYGLQWRHTLASGALAEAQAYSRSTRRNTLNGDAAEVPDGDETASLNRSATRQRSSGLALALAGRSAAHQWQVGLSLDRARVRYEQTQQEGGFTATRGVQAGDEAADFSASVQGSSRHSGLYATDTWRLAAGTHLTATLRHNRSVVGNTLVSVDDDSFEIEAHPHERFHYRSWAPAVGIAQRLGTGEGAPTLFANLALNTRVPTVIELGCANPDEPCRLPAGLQSDPYLKAVQARSMEAGLRWGAAHGSSRGAGGSLVVYRNDNHNDILFSSVNASGQLGYFRNFERTRHQGLELETQWRAAAWDASASYSHLQATYQAAGTLRVGARNVAVLPGTRMAGLPRHALKLALDWRAAPGWLWGLDAQWSSRRGVAGNEDGRLEDNEDTRADLSLPASTRVNLRASWQPQGWKGAELFLRVNNLLDPRSHSYGTLAETVFDAQGHYSGNKRLALFVAPGAPRAAAAGLRLRF